MQLYEEVLKLKKAKLGPNHPGTLMTMNNLAGAYLSSGRTDEAVQLQEEAFNRMKSTLGPDHPDTLVATSSLAVTYQRVGRDDEALRLIEEAIRLRPDRSIYRLVLCRLLSEQGKYAEADAAAREAIRLEPDNADALNGLAGLLANCPDPQFRDAPSAIELAQKAINLVPQNGLLWETLGIAQ